MDRPNDVELRMFYAKLLAAQRNKEGELLSIKELRKSIKSLNKERFDLIANTLMVNNHIVMHYDDTADMKTEAEKREMVKYVNRDGSEVYYLGIAVRK